MLSPLAIACGTGGVKCIDLLVKYGADLNSKSCSGSTPLHECFYRDNIDCFDVLLKHGKYIGIPYFIRSRNWLHERVWHDTFGSLLY